ncbi:unnamed protein product [Adineta steineri]|uniref:F-box domain-containing protein n=1 Tax=Adineta steineri TaxID=433720 RepID=A0A814GZU3_9BILA|nr:unnamed protein product [Adineta steineri]
MSISLIENLSNEIFYEIFEYLDGSEIYQAFSNLNHRFQQLINCSSLLFKFNHDSLILDNTYKQFLLNHKHQIISFYMPNNDFFSSFSIDSSFYQLQSLSIYEISSSVLISLLVNLSSLPRLVSLTIDAQDSLKDFTEVYRLIFILPKLKYIKCTGDEDDISISLPIATNEQLSAIEYFIINHHCAFDTLCTLISYTPQLCHLSLLYLSDCDSDNEIILSVILPNLTYLSIESCNVTFENLEALIIESECNLKVLHVSFYYYYNVYFDDDPWEELIINYLPELKKLHLEYRHDIDPELGSSSNFKLPDQFNSLFWNKKKWVLEVEMCGMEYLYTIRSYEKRWYDVDPCNEISNSTRLKITFLPDDDYLMEFELMICDLLAVTQIYHLEISKENISSNIVLALIQEFSALQTLRISSLVLYESFIYNKNRRYKSAKNEITKVYLEKMSRIEDISFLLQHCPNVEYLKIGFLHKFYIELFFKDILKAIKDDSNRYFRLLCFHIPTDDNVMIEKLKQMIIGEECLHGFTIKICYGND